ncbi:hypothetical protein Tco_0989991 [Tanacetum coccineum]|uniref:Uncharacterized protein n=1 Tax=Tanacetum coccineum TaxID=301880 RepID=A0ABQ5EWM2_9ASTR
MLKICPKLLGQIFEEPPLEEEILSFIKDLGHTGEIKFLSDVNVNHMHQPWRSFVAIINKCLSGKTTALENLVYQVENNNSKKNNDMYYPRFTKLIVDYFMAKDQAIPRRNKMFWHYARDDFMFTTIRLISKPPTQAHKNDANQDDDDEQTDSDNDGDDFVHPKLTTHDDEARQDDEVNEEGSNKESYDESQQQSSSVSSGFVSNMLNPSPDKGIDTIFTPNTEATSLVDVLVTTITEPPLFYKVRNDTADEAQTENALLLNKLLHDTLKKINTRRQVKEQVKAQTRWKAKVNHNPDTEQKNLYKALVDAYESDKLILDTYGDIISFQRRRDDEDKDKEPFARSNRGSKRRRAGKEPESTSAPKEKTSKSSGKSYEGSKSKHKTAGETAQTEEL